VNLFIIGWDAVQESHPQASMFMNGELEQPG
jgi:hypothetical protein